MFFLFNVLTFSLMQQAQIKLTILIIMKIMNEKAIRQYYWNFLPYFLLQHHQHVFGAYIATSLNEISVIDATGF